MAESPLLTPLEKKGISVRRSAPGLFQQHRPETDMKPCFCDCRFRKRNSVLQTEFSMKLPHIARFLRSALSVAFGATAFSAVADTGVPQAPLELTAANLASVVDPLMAEWIGKHKGPGAVVVVVKRDGAVFAKGYASRTSMPRSHSPPTRLWCGLDRSRSFSPASRSCSS
jgi:hypothetical protein